MKSKDQSFAREAFTSEEGTLGVIRIAVEKWAKEYGWDDGFSSFIVNINKTHIGTIFKYCESPIEQTLWAGALVRSAYGGQWLEFWAPPSGQFIEQKKARTQRLDSIGLSKIIYEAHPDRDKCTFEEFVKWKEPSMPESDVTAWVADAVLYFDLGFMFAPTVVLQPSLTLGGKTIRPDAVAFIPAYPNKCIAIECDGFEFHGSQEKFTADRSRDRLISTELGMEVRRYSGHEIYHTPMGVTDDVVNFLELKLGSMAKLSQKWKSSKRAWVRRNSQFSKGNA